MLKIALTLTLFVVFNHFVFAQNKNLHLGFTVNTMKDFNWNKALQFNQPIKNTANLYSNFPFNLGLVLEKQINKNHFFVGFNYLKRNIEKQTNLSFGYFISSGGGGFSYKSLELPLKWNRKIELNKHLSFYYGLGYGLSFNIIDTSLSKANLHWYSTINGQTDSIDYLFEFIPTRKLNHQIKANFSFENKFENGSRLLINIEFSHNLFNDIQFKEYYKHNGTEGLSYSKPISSYYSMIGLIYFPNYNAILKRFKK